MLDMIPNEEEMTALVGKSLYGIWNKLCALIEEKYDMERLWDKGGKAWKYEYKYRRGGKTLCALYARDNCVGFLVILGKDEPADTSLFHDFIRLLQIKRKANRK